jgi:hypothetical protein
MAIFDCDAPADRFPARSRTGRRPVGYRRFATAAQATRYAVAQMPAGYLDGTVLEIDDDRVEGAAIRNLYDSTDDPLTRKPR